MNIMVRAWLPHDVFAELERMQRTLSQSLDSSPSIRGGLRGYPAMNVGGTPNSVEVCVFAPGVDPAALDVQIEKGVLTIAGERKDETRPDQSTVHIGERFSGRFRRVVTLPDDVDAEAVSARYRDGVLRISIARRQAAQPRRITVR
jgi:HSP20 family protein